MAKNYDAAHLDFTPLKNLITYQPKNVGKIFLLWEIATIAISIVVAITTDNIAYALFTWFGGSMAFVLVFAIIHIVQSFKTNKHNQPFIDQFFQINNLTTHATAPLPQNLFFRQGDRNSQKIENQTALTPDITQAIFHYTVTTHDDNGSHTTHYRRPFLRFKLTRHLPHLLLDGKRNSLHSPKGKAKKIALEGGFQKHFQLYIPENYHLDALQVFTPDVMAKFLDLGTKYDYEIINDNLYIYMTKLDYKHLHQTLQTAAALAKEIDEQAHKYSDVRTGNFTVNQVHAAASLIPDKPKFSKPMLIILIIIATLFALQLIASLLVPLLLTA